MRKQSKEERELRKWIKDWLYKTSHPDDHAEREPLRLVRNLVRAVREDCAKVADEHAVKFDYGPTGSGLGINASKQIAAAIRAKGE